MRMEVQRNRTTKWKIQDMVCAASVRPIIFKPSLMRSSFSFTRLLMTFDTGYSTAITTRKGNKKPTWRRYRQIVHGDERGEKRE